MNNVRISSGTVYELLGDGLTANGSGNAVPKGAPSAAFAGTVSGTGSVSATLTIDGSNDGVNWVLGIATMSLTGTTTDTKGAVNTAPYKYVRGTVASLTGTGATVTCTMGI